MKIRRAASDQSQLQLGEVRLARPKGRTDRISRRWAYRTCVESTITVEWRFYLCRHLLHFAKPESFDGAALLFRLSENRPWPLTDTGQTRNYRTAATCWGTESRVSTFEV